MVCNPIPKWLTPSTEISLTQLLDFLSKIEPLLFVENAIASRRCLACARKLSDEVIVTDHGARDILYRKCGVCHQCQCDLLELDHVGRGRCPCLNQFGVDTVRALVQASLAVYDSEDYGDHVKCSVGKEVCQQIQIVMEMQLDSQDAQSCLELFFTGQVITLLR